MAWNEDIVLAYLAQLPDSVEELRQQQAAVRAQREEAQAKARKYDRIQARSTTREAIRRNARRSGNSLQMVRTADEKLEAIRRKLEAWEAGCPCGSCKTPCFLQRANCPEHGPECDGHEPDAPTVGGEVV